MTIRKLGILGASGRMGKALDELASSVFSKRAQVAAAVDMQQGGLDDFAAVDAVIDFSLPAGTASLVEWMENRDGPLPVLVCGTTGLDEELETRMAALGKRTLVIHAHNFSPGIAALSSILAFSAPVLKKLGYTPVMTEVHHQHKKDAPSGTAITLRRAMDPDNPDSTEVQSVRAGEIIGSHEVVFYGSSDRITVGHESLNRDLFARGAIEAALWLCDSPEETGCYTMDEYFQQRYLA